MHFFIELTVSTAEVANRRRHAACHRGSVHIPHQTNPDKTAGLFCFLLLRVPRGEKREVPGTGQLILGGATLHTQESVLKLEYRYPSSYAYSFN